MLHHRSLLEATLKKAEKDLPPAGFIQLARIAE
jgi:DNA-binding LytR/AlgR family response regulator